MDQSRSKVGQVDIDVPAMQCVVMELDLGVPGLFLHSLSGYLHWYDQRWDVVFVSNSVPLIETQMFLAWSILNTGLTNMQKCSKKKANMIFALSELAKVV
ncbi:hypothetical protein llap_3619 [Limosa lapponica baueri]|uniref:Uncharacterized protein n=1 Tax=Limosa lapponica baueri TaxID=1758121 RepID=A0A2I0UJ34_LIMLA|nr:hypothetical protein llap_3619 [Limosa lapponica baueri]